MIIRTYQSKVIGILDHFLALTWLNSNQFEKTASSNFPIYTAPEDYGFVNTTSTFVNTTAQGEPGSQMCIEIQIFNNNVVEFDKVFQVTADSPDPNVNTTFITATIVIMEEDGERYVIICTHVLAGYFGGVLLSLANHS